MSLSPEITGAAEIVDFKRFYGIVPMIPVFKHIGSAACCVDTTMAYGAV